MGLLGEIFLLPLAPVRGVTWIAEKVRDEAVRERDESTGVEAELAELDRQVEAGELSKDEAERREEELLETMLLQSGPGGPGP